MGCDDSYGVNGWRFPVFQSTHPSGVRPYDSNGMSRKSLFQSTHPSGVRLYMTRRQNRFNQFQSTHPSGVRLADIRGHDPHRQFQSTHPSGVRPGRPPRWAPPQWYFNPRTPVGCDTPETASSLPTSISIHAPQWGATARRRRALVVDDISIHAPQWGATEQDVAVDVADAISIHAPQWGATGLPSDAPSPSKHFNPRTPVGCDKTIRATRGWRCNFNPRTPVGCDITRKAREATVTVFQSTHPSGVRRVLDDAEERAAVFQSTHPSGVRLVRRIHRPAHNHFNPRTPVGCDSSGLIHIVTPVLFQSTHPSGVRHRCPPATYART